MNLPSFLHGSPLRVYESHGALGCFAPVPFASVELSEQYAALRSAKESGSWSAAGPTEGLAKAYLTYRFGKIQLANGMFKDSLGAVGGLGEEARRFALWGTAVTSTMQRDYAESNELLEYLRKRFEIGPVERRALAYWRLRNRIGLGSDMPLAECLERVGVEEASWQLIDLYARDASFERGTAIRLLECWGLGRDGTYSAGKWRLRLGVAGTGEEDGLFGHSGFALDHHTMLAYLDRHGVERFLAGCKRGAGGLPYTSEALAALALHSVRVGGPERYRELYTPERVVHLGRIELSEEEREHLVVESVGSDLGIRDFNTSNFGGRTYTLDLAGEKNFSDLNRKVRECVRENYSRLRGLMVGWLQPEFSELGSWFDASFTSGGSNIFPHLHTAGTHKTYYFTVVFYAQVPTEMKPGEGDLIFTDTDIADTQYRKTPITNRVKVVTGDLYAFPSHFFHSTTPSCTRKVRLTFNFDFSTERKTLPLT